MLDALAGSVSDFYSHRTVGVIRRTPCRSLRRGQQTHSHAPRARALPGGTHTHTSMSRLHFIAAAPPTSIPGHSPGSLNLEF